MNEWYQLEGEIVFRDTGIIDTISRHPSYTNRPFWILVIMKRGQRTLRLNGEEIRAGMNEFLLLPHLTKIEPLEYDDHTACFLHFFARGTPVGVPARVEPSRLLLPVKGPLPPDIDFYAYASALVKHYYSPYADRGFLAMQLRALLSMISLECQKNPHHDEHGTLAEQVLHFIQNNACSSIRAQDYEKVLGRSYHQINRIFKAQFGCTVKQHHMHIRMEHAAQMLSLGKSVQETAENCGFEDYFFFINSFTKAHGISPAAYSRKERFGG